MFIRQNEKAIVFSPRGIKLSLFYYSKLQLFFPLGVAEADEHEGVGDEEWAFYKHSVGCEQGVLLCFGHFGELCFQFEGFIEQSRCIEEFFERKSAVFVPGFYFIHRGILLLYIADLVLDFIVVEVLFCLLASSAFRVADKFKHVFLL